MYYLITKQGVGIGGSDMCRGRRWVGIDGGVGGGGGGRKL